MEEGKDKMRTNIRRRPAVGVILALAAIALFAVSQSGLVQAANPLPQMQVWAGGELFATVVTPAEFDPESDPFDELYAGGNGFKDGAPLISDSKPGDTDYNGGRWHLNVLKGSVDPDKYKNATAATELDPNDFDSMDVYFECPLLPRRGG